MRGPSLGARLFGLGSVFGKTLRDSRWAALGVLTLLVLMVVAGGIVMSSTYGTAETRAGLAAMARAMPPELRGLYGDPRGVETLGGFIGWHYGSYVVLISGLWSILALSSTLAGETRRASLDLVVVTPRSRGAIALAKLGGHLAAVAIVTAIVAPTTWLTGLVFDRFPGDAIAPDAAISFAAGIAIRGVAMGAFAFALAGLLGRSAGAGIAGALMLGGTVVHGYRTVVPAFATIDPYLPWSWGADHRPLTGAGDPVGLAVTAGVAVALLALGVIAFARTDLGVVSTLRGPRLPRRLLGVGGPLARGFGELLPGAAWWTFGLAVYAAAMIAVAALMLDLLATAPALERVFRTIVPGIDLATTAGLLQYSFVDLGCILVGLAVATFLSTAWGDETGSRLESLLATPLSRVRWLLAATGACLAALALVTGTLGLTIGAGVAASGEAASDAAAGSLVLGVYGIALVGIGMAAGGLFGGGTAAPVAAGVAILTFLLDTFAPMLRLPAWLSQLAITSHLGEPLVGRADLTGIALCLAIGLAGLAVGTWRIAGRDLAG